MKQTVDRIRGFAGKEICFMSICTRIESEILSSIRVHRRKTYKRIEFVVTFYVYAHMHKEIKKKLIQKTRHTRHFRGGDFCGVVTGFF